MLFRGLYSPEGGLSTNRLESFSDGVFGVAITLLILAVGVPRLSEAELTHGGLLSALVVIWPSLLIYVVSFAIVGIFWVGHHIMFAYIERTDRTLLWLNMLLLMAISFVPFAADLLGRYSRDPIALAVYGCTLGIAGAMFEIVWVYASTGHRLIRRSMHERLVRLGALVIAVSPVVYFAAALIAFWSVSASLVIFVLTPLFYIIPGPIDDLVASAGSHD